MKNGTTETQPFPGWKNAIVIITDRVDKEGFGVQFSHEEINEMLYVKKPETGTFEDFEKFSLEKLTQLEKLKDELYECHNLCLDSVHGKGYQILHPIDQVRKKPGEHLKKAGREIKKALRCLINVQDHLLDAETRRERDTILNRVAFIKRSMGNRRLAEGESESKKAG